jgi:hypothetical protein
MKKIGSALLLCTLVSTLGAACSSDNAKSEPDPENMGTLAFPLLANSPSGTQYRLRNARFDISGYSYNYDYNNDAGAAGGMGSNYTYQVVSSEDDPNSPSIELDLERGDYYIYLENGWTLESITNGVATPVEATLLNSQYQWVYVYPHSTTWVSYQFGVGDRSIWLNGKVNIGIDVYDNPDQYYGPGVGGSTSYPIATGGASYGVGGSTAY